MGSVTRFEDLEIWKGARCLVNRIYDLTSECRIAEDRALCRQMQRAAVSVMANIAEGFERSTNKEFIQFLYMARGSAGEVRSHLYVAYDRKYISEEEFAKASAEYETLSKRIAAFISYLKNAQDKRERVVTAVSSPVND
jgi:four helix bundle protein